MSRLKKQTKATKLIVIPGAVGLLLLIFIVSGCGGPPEPPPKPKVIAKKMPVEKSAPPGAVQPLKTDISTTGKKKDKPVEPSGKPATSPVPSAAATVKPLGKKSTDFVATYDWKEKIDPFKSFLKLKEGGETPPPPPKGPKRQCDWAPRSPTTPLEFIDLGQLKLVGVIRAGSGNRALVQEATGKGYVIKKGTYIGRNEGTVSKILRDRIIIKECVKDMYDIEKVRNTELRIEKPPGEF